MKTEPQKEHLWLQKLLGDWTYEAEAVMKPDEAPIKSQGTESVRSIGGLWVVAEGQGEMPGSGPGSSIMTLGYDPLKKHYVGTWIGSMMTNLWVYQGTLDATGVMLVLDTEGPSMADDGKMSRYQDVIEFKNDDHRILSAQVLGDDGEWRRIMTANYRRKNAGL